MEARRSPLSLCAADGHVLAADLWSPQAADWPAPRGIVVINPATAVRADYYHRYARYLTEHGFAVLTYDYRGIGASRQGSLRRWRHFTKTDWGRLDCDVALSTASCRYPGVPLLVVGHSIGGMVVGLAPASARVSRCLTVGAQYAYWPDYAQRQRWSMWLRWHCLMPALTAVLGYFPARALGWHEDLPAGAAYEWAFRGPDLPDALDRAFLAFRGELLAIGLSDDPFGTPAALKRLLRHFKNGRRALLTVEPASVGLSAIGHFAFFHERFRDTLWRDSLDWLATGEIAGRTPEPFIEGENHA